MLVLCLLAESEPRTLALHLLAIQSCLADAIESSVLCCFVVVHTYACLGERLVSWDLAAKPCSCGLTAGNSIVVASGTHVCKGNSIDEKENQISTTNTFYTLCA